MNKEEVQLAPNGRETCNRFGRAGGQDNFRGRLIEQSGLVGCQRGSSARTTNL